MLQCEKDALHYEVLANHLEIAAKHARKLSYELKANYFSIEIAKKAKDNLDRAMRDINNSHEYTIESCKELNNTQHDSKGVLQEK